MRKPCMRTSKRMEHTAAAVSTFHPQPGVCRGLCASTLQPASSVAVADAAHGARQRAAPGQY